MRCLSFRFQAFGRPVKNSKKFEEGIFSDLRNLKSGTDASLEEPKSGFLDFLYKNNCIRTQKKQKVFYWYSVPHDRLFLDALERDLKREKMGQEATTIAVSEPALSFQFDSSQSLFEQLTKAQQTNSSSFSAQQSSFASTVPATTTTTSVSSKSPVIRSMDSMPPPQMMPLSIPEEINSMGAYYQMTSMPSMAQQVVKRESDFARSTYNSNTLSGAHSQPRHSSLPAYALEYSPTPSFVSSHFDDYSNRAISFEPITPPQQAMGIGSESAYIATEETGLYSAIPEHMGGSSSLHNMLHMPSSNLATPQFSTGSTHSSSTTPSTTSHSNRGFPPPPTNAYAVMEGTPNYKQRRRRSSIPPGAAAMMAAAAAAASGQGHPSHRPSDLRRSISASVGPIHEADVSNCSQSDLSYTNRAATMAQMSPQRKDLMDMSRQGTPLASVEDSPSMNSMGLPSHSEFNHMSHEDMTSDGILSTHDSPRSHLSGAVAAIRRARSTTMMDASPYPQRSHSCPIPTCGRLFKRLEHLKRFVISLHQKR